MEDIDTPIITGDLSDKKVIHLNHLEEKEEEISILRVYEKLVEIEGQPKKQQQQQQRRQQHQYGGKLREIDLSCGFCKKSLFKPRLLNCLHTFCEDCIRNNITFLRSNSSFSSENEEEDQDDGYIKCLVCFEFTKLPPKNDVCMLPYNFFANNAMDYLLVQCRDENAILCTGCSDTSEAISRCAECSEFLCIQCISAHRRIRITKDHKITPLDSLRYDKTAIHRPVFCPEHEPELFTYYCEACEDLICKECTILQHKGHHYESE